MRTVYDAAGGTDGLLRLAEAWHVKVMADVDDVSDALSARQWSWDGLVGSTGGDQR